MSDKLDRFILDTAQGIRIISTPQPQPDKVILPSEEQNG